MNKRNIIYGASAFVLSIAAFLAAKSNHKFDTDIANLYYTTGGTNHTCKFIASNVFKTVGTGGVNCIVFETENGGNAKTFATKTFFFRDCEDPITNCIRLAH